MYEDYIPYLVRYIYMCLVVSLPVDFLGLKDGPPGFFSYSGKEFKLLRSCKSRVISMNADRAKESRFSPENNLKRC